MSLDLYTSALKNQDWYFEYSDDYRVWYSGSIKKRELVRMQKLYDEDYVLWNSYAPKEFKIIVDK